MLWSGHQFPNEEIEIGNAWYVYPGSVKNGWFVGHTATSPLRLMTEATAANSIAVKWYEHDHDEPENLGKGKPVSTGRSISLLVNDGGRFQVKFWKEANPAEVFTVLLTSPGDYVIWGPGFQHEWRCLAKATVLTVRWIPL